MSADAHGFQFLAGERVAENVVRPSPSLQVRQARRTADHSKRN
jgi:hypothetical protein